MPWLIDVTDDGTNDFVWGDDPFDRVIMKDQDIFSKRVGSVFPFREDFSHLLDHAEFEYGRVFYSLKRARKAMPARAGAYWYCDRFKRILEELEPGKHRFARIDIRMPDKVTPWPEPYWYWRCENFVDAIIPCVGDGDPRRSTNIFWNADKGWLSDRAGQFLGSSYRPLPLDKPVLNVNAISGLCAWRDSGFIFKHSVNQVFLSDIFVERLKAEKAVKGLELGLVATSELPAVCVLKARGK
jgi:hypothetical protein